MHFFTARRLLNEFRNEKFNFMDVSSSEVAPIASLEMPKDEVLAKIAAQLGESQAKIQAILADFIADQKAN